MRLRTPLVLFVLLSSLLPAPAHATDPVAGADGFARAVLAGWGTADVGGAWSTTGPADRYSVGAGAGTIRLGQPGSTGGALQRDLVARDSELAVAVRLDRLPVGGNAFAYLVGRHSDDAEYRLKLRIDPTGAVFLQATRLVGGSEAGIGPELLLPDMVAAPDTAIRLRGRIDAIGPTRLQLRAWPDGAPEPETWHIDEVDATPALVAAGPSGVRTYVGSSVTNAPVSVRFDDWVVTSADAPVAATPTLPPATPTAMAPGPPDPPAGELAVDDRFMRDSSAGWGVAPVGGTWGHQGNGGDAWVDGARGHLRTLPGATRSALLDVAVRDVETLLTVRPDALPAGGNAWLYVVLRQTAGGEARGRVRVTGDGAVFLGLSVVVDGAERTLGPEVRVDGLATGPLHPIRVRVQGLGQGVTTWSIRAWPASAAEPEGWALRVTDDTATLQGPGAVGLRAYLGRSATNDDLAFLVDRYRATVASPVVTDEVLVGAGDIAICDSRGSERTALLLDAIPGTVFAVGDLAYPNSSLEELTECFDPTWGRHKDRMLPVVGNRDYGTPGAAGYFAYFGEAAAGPGGYYATDLGSWRVYVLNSQCEFVSCDADAEQAAWLRQDLAANPRQCSLALFHEPRFTSGPHGDTEGVGPFWDALYAAGVDLVVSGHDHDYERLLPMAPSGSVDPAHGIRQFIAGTGGGGGAEFEVVRANSVVRDGETYGVLKLTLRADGYDWVFVPIAGRTFTDSGSAHCHEAPVATP